MDKRKEKKVEEVKENKNELARSRTFIDERHKIIELINGIKMRERQREATINQHDYQLKEIDKSIMFMKEDLYFLLKGKNIEGVKKDMDEHYTDVTKRGEEIINILR